MKRQKTQQQRQKRVMIPPRRIDADGWEKKSSLRGKCAKTRDARRFEEPKEECMADVIALTLPRRRKR